MDTLLHTLPRLALPPQYLYPQIQRHPHHLHIKSLEWGLWYWKSGPSSIRLGCTCIHFQYLWTGCKKESCLPIRGRINSSYQETHKRFLKPGPAGHEWNCITSGSNRGIPQAHIPHRIIKAPCNGGYNHHCLLLSLTEWRVHKTLQGKTKWVVGLLHKNPPIPSTGYCFLEK